MNECLNPQPQYPQPTHAGSADLHLFAENSRVTFSGMEKKSSGKAGGIIDNCYKSKSCEERTRLVGRSDDRLNSMPLLNMYCD